MKSGCMGLLNLNNFIVQRTMSKQARRFAKVCKELYRKANVSVSDPKAIEAVKKATFDDERLERMTKPLRERFEICCETVQGFCYTMVLDMGALRGWMVLRSLQFTSYMDKELEKQGFPPQAKKQKERILEAMKMKVDNWDEITGD